MGEVDQQQTTTPAAIDETKLENDRQEIFCHEYCVDLIATKAAIRAGYAESGAHVEGSRLLKIPKIRARIAEIMDARSARTLVDADYIVNSLVEVHNRCMQNVPVMIFNPVEKCMEQATEPNAAGEEVGLWSFDSNGANKALELLGRHVAMFNDKLKVTSTMEQPLFPETSKT